MAIEMLDLSASGVKVVNMDNMYIFTKLIKDGKLPHAIMLESIDKVCLHKMAANIAMALLCEGETDIPCGKCTPCVKALDGNHPDIYTLEPDDDGKAIKVDAIRSMREDAFLKPNEAPYKIYIINSAELMNDNAQNALLKILEEPPENVFFILCSASADRMLDTILSRVVVYRLDKSDFSIAGFDAPRDAKDLAKDIVKSMCSEKELDLLIATGKLITAKKDIAKILDVLELIARNACVYTYGVQTDEQDEVCLLLATSKRSKALIKFIDIINSAREKAAQNVNINLLATWLCAELRRL